MDSMILLLILILPFCYQVKDHFLFQCLLWPKFQWKHFLLSFPFLGLEKHLCPHLLELKTVMVYQKNWNIGSINITQHLRGCCTNNKTRERKWQLVFSRVSQSIDREAELEFTSQATDNHYINFLEKVGHKVHSWKWIRTALDTLGWNITECDSTT